MRHAHADPTEHDAFADDCGAARDTRAARGPSSPWWLRLAAGSLLAGVGWCVSELVDHGRELARIRAQLEYQAELIRDVKDTLKGR